MTQENWVVPEPVSSVVALALRPVDTIALDHKKQEAAKALAALERLPCESEQQEQAFSDFLTFTCGQIADLEADRKTRTDPLQKEKTRIDKVYKPVRDCWEKVEGLIRRKLQGAAQLRLDREQQLRQLAAESARQGHLEQAVHALASVPESPLVSGVANGSVWSYDVVDETQIPREWLVLDIVKVTQHLGAHRNSQVIPSVPGLVFKRVATVRRT